MQQIESAVLCEAQQVAVKSFCVLCPGYSGPACSLCVVCRDGGSECGCCGWQHLSTHHAGITDPWGRRWTFLCLDQRAQRDSMLKQSRKLIGYTYLVFVPVWISFFPLLRWGKRFSSEPNLYSWASRGWRISLECSEHLGTITFLNNLPGII